MWLDPEKQDEQNPEEDSLNSPTVGAGGGIAQPQASSTTGNASTVSPVQTSKPQDFATIQDYFKGNQTQGEKLGGQFTDRLVGQEKEQIGQAASKAKGDIAAGTVGFDPSLTAKLETDPTALTKDTNQFDSFLKQWNAEYKGPQSFESTEEYGQAADAVNKAKQNAAQVASTGGRQQFIQDKFGVYGQGNKGLDEALLQQSSYFPKVQSQEKEFGNIQDYLTSQSADVNAAAQAAKQQTAATKQQIQAAGGKAVTDFKTNLQNKLKTAQQTSTNDYNTLRDTLAQGQPVSPGLLKKMGISDEEWKTITVEMDKIKKGGEKPTLAEDVSSFVRPTNTIGLSDVATTEDYAKDAAYKKLMSTSNVLSGGPSGKNLDPSYDAQSLRDYLERNKIKPPPPPAPKEKKDLPNIITDPIGEVIGMPGATEKIGNIVDKSRETLGDIGEVVAKPGRQIRDELDRTGQTLKEGVEDTIGKDASKVIGNIAETGRDVAKEIATAPTNALVDFLKNPKEEASRIGDSILNTVKDPGSFLTGVGEKVTGTIDKILGGSGDKVSKLAPIEYANNQFESTLKDITRQSPIAASMLKNLPAQYQPRHGTDYTIPPVGAIPGDQTTGNQVRNLLITLYWQSAMQQGWNPAEGVNKGISQQELRDAFKQSGTMVQLLPQQQEFVAAYDKANPPKVTTREDVMAAIEKEKAQRKKDAEAGKPRTDIVSTQPVVNKPAEPVPQFNPGVTTPAPAKKPSGVMRAFSEGGMVESNLQDYLKRNKR